MKARSLAFIFVLLLSLSLPLIPYAAEAEGESSAEEAAASAEATIEETTSEEASSPDDSAPVGRSAMEEALDALPDNPTYEDYIKFAETADLEDPQHVYTGDNEVNLLSTRVSSPYWSSSTKGVRTVYEADGTVFLKEAVKVIDVSKWQGDIDWDAVAKTDVDAVILRIGYGVGYTDAKFERNLAACQRLGIPFGVYTYSYAYDGNVATEEAQWIIQLFNKYGLDKDTPVFYDLEQWTMTGHTPPTSPAAYDTIVNNFFNTLSASGFTNVHVYSYYSYLNGPLKSQNIWSKTSWVARYNGYLGFDIQSPSGMKGWQYSSSGSVSGISGNVDMNAFAATEDWLSGKWIYENGNYYYQNGDGSLAKGWLKLRNTWYYLDPETGAMWTGLVEIGGSKYYLDNSGAMRMGWIKLDGIWYYFSGSGAMQTGWLSNGGKWYWLDPETGAMATGVVKTGSAWSSFNSSGHWLGYLAGWNKIDGIWYWLVNGVPAKGWLSVGGKWYYLDPDTGAMATGVTEIPGDGTYNLSASGAMLIGWRLDGSTWYYHDGSGRMATGWVLVSGKWFYLDPDTGAMATGWIDVAGHRFYLDGSGAMRTGWQLLGGERYYFDGSGAMRTGWQYLGGKWYYLDPDTGAMATGWVDVAGHRFYLDGSGAMRTGWQLLGGEWYYFDGSGAMRTGWLKINAALFYLDESGSMLTGWFEVDGERYYADSTGNVLRGWILLNGKWYLTNSETGVMLTGWQFVSGSHFYLDPESGVMFTGLKEIDGEKYYFDGSGALNVGWIRVDNSLYYFDPTSGAMATGLFSVGDANYCSSADGIVYVEQWVTLPDGTVSYADSTGMLHGSLVDGVLFVDGVQASGWVLFGGTYFYADPSSGKLLSGWQLVGGSWFYMDPDTYAMVTGWRYIDDSWYYFNSSGYMVTGWAYVGGYWYYMNSSGVMQTGWVTVGGVPYHLSSSGAWITTHYHNVAWAGQPNNIYCGPTAGYMILRNVGAGNSRYNGASLSINSVANHMETDRLGYTSFNNRKFQQGMNRWLGSNIYSTWELPSYSSVRNEIMDSFRNGYATAFDAHERRGGPHYNGHNNSTFSHIVVVDGYNQSTDQVYIVDPGARVLWGGASTKFWYSLSSFVSRFVNSPDRGYRDGIGMYYATN